jgi:hypothetical protein
MRPGEIDSENAVRRAAIKSLVFLSLILSPQATRISMAADREKEMSPAGPQSVVWRVKREGSVPECCAAVVRVCNTALKTLTLVILY